MKSEAQSIVPAVLFREWKLCFVFNWLREMAKHELIR